MTWPGRGGAHPRAASVAVKSAGDVFKVAMSSPSRRRSRTRTSSTMSRSWTSTATRSSSSRRPKACRSITCARYGDFRRPHAMDPHTGRVLAMTGGWSYKQSEFNRATQAMRQPGRASSRSSIWQPSRPATRLDHHPGCADRHRPGPGLPLWQPRITRRLHGPPPCARACSIRAI